MKRLSEQFPALAIGAGALVVALTGVATAGPTTSSAGVTPAQVRSIAKTVADAEVRRLAPRLTVASAQTASSPALYAQVTAGGVVTANSRGIVQANLTHPQRGFYCFSGLARAPKGGLVTIDTNVPGGGSGADLAQVGVTGIGRCPAGTQAHVATFTPSEGFADDPFFVVFWY